METTTPSDGHARENGAPAPSSVASMLSTLVSTLSDAEQLAVQYGSIAAATDRLLALERLQQEHTTTIATLQTQLATIQQELLVAQQRPSAAAFNSRSNRTGAVSTSTADEGFTPLAIVNHLKMQFVCGGDLTLIREALEQLYAQTTGISSVDTESSNSSSSDGFRTAPVMPPRLRLLTVQELSIPFVHNSVFPALPPAVTTSLTTPTSDTRNVTMTTTTPRLATTTATNKAKLKENVQIPPPPHAPPSTPVDSPSMKAPTSTSSATSSSQLQNNKPNTRGPTKKRTRAETASVSTAERTKTSDTPAAAAVGAFTTTSSLTLESNGSTEKKRRVPRGTDKSTAIATGTESNSAATSSTAGNNEFLVVKQIITWPAERRVVSEMRQSSMLLTLEGMAALEKLAPWNEMYRRRPMHSHILNSESLAPGPLEWFRSVLKFQFEWRREFWERLHWLPMSENVCIGDEWRNYREDRKKRRQTAVAAWRKIYEQSIQMMEVGMLPDDIWCDPVLWYMPGTPCFWMPRQPDMLESLREEDTKYPQRCYYVGDLSKHPFYANGHVEKYPHKYDLPSFYTWESTQDIPSNIDTKAAEQKTVEAKDDRKLEAPSTAPSTPVVSSSATASQSLASPASASPYIGKTGKKGESKVVQRLKQRIAKLKVQAAATDREKEAS